MLLNLSVGGGVFSLEGTPLCLWLVVGAALPVLFAWMTEQRWANGEVRVCLLVVACDSVVVGESGLWRWVCVHCALPYSAPLMLPCPVFVRTDAVVYLIRLPFLGVSCVGMPFRHLFLCKA
jgi:hypothetical protein